MVSHDRYFGRLAHEYAKFGISNWNYYKQRLISRECNSCQFAWQLDIDYTAFCLKLHGEMTQIAV